MELPSFDKWSVLLGAKSLLMDDKIPPLVVFTDGLLYSFVDDYFTLIIC